MREGCRKTSRHYGEGGLHKLRLKRRVRPGLLFIVGGVGAGVDGVDGDDETGEGGR